MTKKILKFSATWCAPCSSLSKTLEDSVFNDIEIVHVDIEEDENQDLVNQYQIRNIPTCIYFKDDVEVGKTVGNISKEKILEQFN